MEMEDLKRLDPDLLAGIMAEFENGKDAHEGNPFDAETDGLSNRLNSMVVAFTMGNAVPQTTKFLEPHDNEQDARTYLNRCFAAMAHAGLMQGMFIGYEYAKREGGRDGG